MRTDDGTLDLEALEALIGPRTRLVAIGRASNALGTITEISSVVDEAHSRDALVFVDAVHSAAHERTDVREIGCDFLTCSPYKFYGPHLGVMYARGDVLADLDVARLEPAADTGPERMETGTLPHEAVVGAGEAVQFLADLGDSGVLGDSADLAGGGSQDGAISESAESERSADGERRAALDRSFIALHQHGSELVTRMWEGLASVPGVRLFGPGPSEPRTPTVGFVVEAVASSVVSSRLSDEAGVFVSHGDFYATTVVRRLGLGEEGLVRAGAACYTTEDEVDRLVAGVRRISG